MEPDTEKDERPHPRNSKEFSLLLCRIKGRLSPRLSQLLEGLQENGDSGNNPEEPPPWLDRELFDRGRQFYHHYLFGLSLSNLLALVLTIGIKDALQPLLFTGRSDSPSKALRRYFSTVLHIITWFTGDVWDPSDPAHEDILAVRATHNSYATIFNNSAFEKVCNINVEQRGHEEPNNSLNHIIRQDLKEYANNGVYENPLQWLPQELRLFISQFHMSATQYAFMGLFLAHPQELGGASASEEDLAALIHFWRGLGWLLGIEDRYNFCSGTVAETRELCLEFEREIAIPALAHSDWDYEHMSDSLITGLSMAFPLLSYPAMLRYLSYILGLPAHGLVKTMSYSDSFKYWLYRSTFSLILLAPRVMFHLSQQMLNLCLTMKNRGKLKMSSANDRDFGNENLSSSNSGCPFA